MNKVEIGSNPVIPQRDPPKETTATLGMVLAMIGKVVASINESYEVAGEANRKFIELSFDFVKQSAKSMKTAEIWKAAGMIAGGVLGLGLGAASLKASSNLASQAKANAPQIQEKADQIRALNGPQLGSERLIAERAPQGIQRGPQEVEMVEMRASPHPANPRDANIDRRARIEVREHPEYPQAENRLTDAEKNREVRALEMEKDLLDKQDPKLAFWANSHIVGQPISQGIGGITQAVASGHEETAKVEQGTSRVFETEQGLSSGLYGNLHQTIMSALIIDTIMQGAIAASQIR